MPIFDMFKRQPKIEGELGYFNLGDWWLQTFTEHERNYIEKIYNPISTSNTSRPLTQGKIEFTTQTAASLLWCMASWFKKPEDYPIGSKIAEKAVELSGNNVLDKHFALLQLITICYRSREKYEDALVKAIAACEQQIAIAPEAAKAFKKEYREQPLPAHTGYEQLAIVYEKNKAFEDAIKLCTRAMNQGWNGDWEKRIKRCQEKMNKKR